MVGVHVIIPTLNDALRNAKKDMGWDEWLYRTRCFAWEQIAANKLLDLACHVGQFDKFLSKPVTPALLATIKNQANNIIQDAIGIGDLSYDFCDRWELDIVQSESKMLLAVKEK